MRLISFLSNRCSSAKALIVVGSLLVSATVVHAQSADTEVLASYYNKGVQPGLAMFAGTAQELSDSAEQFCANPDQKSLQQAQDAWRESYMAWCRAAPFTFGGDGDLGLEKSIEQWPINETIIALLISGGIKEEKRIAVGRSNDLRGYGGGGDILFAAGSPKEAATSTGCSHLLEITDELSVKAAKVQQEWEQDFKEKFLSAGNGKPFLLTSDALGLAVGRALNVVEIMLAQDIGLTSNFFQGDARPHYIPAWRSKSSSDAFRASLEGLRLALDGTGDASILKLVATRDGIYFKKNPGLARDIRKQLAKVEKAVAALGDDDLYKKLQDKPNMLKPLYKQLQTLQTLIVEAALVLELDIRTPLEGRFK